MTNELLNLSKEQIDELIICADYNIMVGQSYGGLPIAHPELLPALDAMGCIHKLKTGRYVVTVRGAMFLAMYHDTKNDVHSFQKMQWYIVQFPDMKAELEKQGDW